jgi:hypothetical protein
MALLRLASAVLMEIDEDWMAGGNTLPSSSTHPAETKCLLAINLSLAERLKHYPRRRSARFNW